MKTSMSDNEKRGMLAVSSESKLAHAGQGTGKPKRNIARAVVLLGAAATVLVHTYGATARSFTGSLPDTRHGKPTSPVRIPGNKPGGFEWADVKPSRDLIWHRCYDDYDCARVDLPMDWLHPSDSLRVTIAVIRLNASVPPTDSSYGGPIFFNPGGPGGSGVSAMLDRGRRIQGVAGRNYDLISFDPRGIGASLPRVDCWGGNAERRRIWEMGDVGVVDAAVGNLHQGYARARAFSEVCAGEMEESQLLYHVSTPSHARDLLELLRLTGQERLKYWGFSYGTVFGGYFASMYPDKVERLVSDGNVDYLEWAQQAHINFNRDTDKVIEAFYRLCHKAGPEVCAFHAESPDAIKTRFATLLDTLRTNPVTVPADPASGPDMPQFITWTALRRFTVSVLYRPLKMFTVFAELLAALEEGNGRPFYELVMAGGMSKSFCDLESPPPGYPRLEPVNNEATTAIQCSDRPDFQDTVESIEEYTKQIMELSEISGDVNAATRLMCVGWKGRPKWNFTGPFGGKTHHPILYVNNVADNITPLISARNDSALFEGSVVLTQNSYGHTSLAAPSTCTARYIRAYFRDGILPAKDTLCEPDYAPFDELPSSKLRAEHLSGGDEDESLAMEVLELSMSNWMLEDVI